MKLIRKADGRVSTFHEVDAELQTAGIKYTPLWANLVSYMLDEKVALFVDAATEMCPNWDLYDDVAACLDVHYTLDV